MKCFAITLPNNQTASKQFERCKNISAKFGITVNKFDAIVGLNLTVQDFIDEGLNLLPNTNIYKKPKFLGTFMSHYHLWKSCVLDNEDYIIFESDAVLTAPIPDLDLSSCVIKLHLDKGTETSKVTGKWSKGSYAYAISPKLAQRLIDGIKSKNVKPSDVCIGDLIVPWKHYHFDLVQHVANV
jgi:GR25 family glycosyltransferase involved in LPS biosynthesis